jgi:hypothetical protein
MDQVRSELALANAQELINVSGSMGIIRIGRGFFFDTRFIIENQRKVLFKVCS